jgi:hypothetical protein
LCIICLRDLSDSRSRPRLECPICRNPINTNINDIPKNRFIIQYLETLNPNTGSDTTLPSTSFNHNTHTDNNNTNDNHSKFASYPSAPPALDKYQSNTYNIPVSYENTANNPHEYAFII